MSNYSVFNTFFVRYIFNSILLLKAEMIMLCGIFQENCLQSSFYFHEQDAYGVLGNNESYESISGFEGLRLGSIKPSEYHMLTSQGASDSNESKVMSYDAEMGQGFDSSFWLEKEVSSLFPKTASRHQTVAICAWCRNEFQHDYVNPETHSDSGSVGLMCGTCQAKFSSEFNPL